MLNIVLQIISLVLCGVGLLQVVIGSKRWKQPIFFYVVFYVSLFLYTACVLAGLVIEGQPGDFVHTAMVVFYYFELLLAFFIGFICIKWLLYRISVSIGRKAQYWLVNTLFFLQTIVLSGLHFSGFCYYIDSDNILKVRQGYYILLVVWSLWILYAVYLLIKYRKTLRPKTRYSYWTLGTISTAAILLQAAIRGINFASFAASIGAVLLIILVNNNMVQEQIESELEIEKLKTDIMLSQIRPHFLYNSLTTIKHLCRVDPSGAEKAVTEFAYYLRGNMDSLTADMPIDFTDELNHTQVYLSLEKLRFGDDLTIEEQIECTSFMIPALTLQPIVENAVRHGVREKEDGKGTVTITAEEYPDRYEITVTDDGKGFDTQILEGDDKEHLGIRNVRYRLEHMSGGSLTIESSAGHGTTAVISLPNNS